MAGMQQACVLYASTELPAQRAMCSRHVGLPFLTEWSLGSVLNENVLV